MVRKFIDIKGNKYDLWEIKTIEKSQEFTEFADDWEYSIIINREGIATNLNGVKIRCEDEEDMLDTIKQIQLQLEDDETIAFL